ncbi:VPS16 protein, partial [Rhodinocichla rosea]|nr:VPS16 protein [Rhodinocichla rosea]
EVLQNHVLEAQVFHTEFGTGVAILTGALRFSLATNIEDLKLRRLPEVPGLQKAPPCWTVLAQDRVTMVLLAMGQELFLLDNTSCSVLVRPFGNLGRGCAVPTVPTVPTVPWGVPSSFPCALGCSQVLFPSHRIFPGAFLGIVEGGDGSCRVLPGPGSGTRCHPQAGAAPGPRCVPVPAEASQEIFRIASMAPGALLLEAQKEYEKESQKADEYLREIREQQLLPEAVGQCIEAAGYEHEPDTQKSLLRAASFGKCFLDKFPPEGFVRMCQDLRVLNAIRDYQIGIPLTFTQYKQLTIEVLLDRLVLRRLYPLAIRICEFLRLPEMQGVSRILAHWACYKVQQKDKSDEEVAQAISQKLGDAAGISYSDIATRAYDCGRAELAIKVGRWPGAGDTGWHRHPPPVTPLSPGQLLEYEPRSGEQVPLLLKMKRSKLALGKAIESGDTDLVYTVVLHLKNELNRGSFFMTLQNQPVALSLYRQFCRHQERETLKDLYNQDDNHQELGNLHVLGGYC